MRLVASLRDSPARLRGIDYTCGMKRTWYAETPARRSRQAVADVLSLVGLVLCMWLGTTVHDTTEKLVGPGERIESAGVELSQRMDEAASAVDGIPAVGDEVAEPFSDASGVGQRIEDAGVQQQEVVRRLATVLGWTTGGLPAVVLLLAWLPLRLRFTRLAAEARLLRGSSAGIDLLALRALARQPISVLLRTSDAPVDGWRREDPDVVSSLAALELAGLGVQSAPIRPPPAAPGSR
jgi:hypothetical protein